MTKFVQNAKKRKGLDGIDDLLQLFSCLGKILLVFIRKEIR